MDLDSIVDEMNDDEKFAFYSSATEYFRYIQQEDQYIEIQKKLNGEGKLSKEEWQYISNKLFVVSCRALMEEGHASSVDKMLASLSKMLLKVFKEDSYVGIECKKMIEYLYGVQKEKEINKDLLSGLDIVVDEKEESALDSLLHQHEEASIFRDNLNAFVDEYHLSEAGYLSQKEKMYIHSFHMAYDKGKEAFQKIKK